MPLYVADKVKLVDGDPVPNVPGLGRWFWLDISRKYFVSENVLALPVPPKKYPNGVAVDLKGVLLYWVDGVPVEKDPLPGVPDDAVLKAVESRKLTVDAKL